MGRTKVILDGSGYKYCSEPGADFEFRPATLLTQLRAAYKSVNPGKAQPGQDQDKLWIPTGTDSVMSLPLPLRTGWVHDARLSDYVCRKSNFVYWNTPTTFDGTHPDPVIEFRPSKTLSGTVIAPDYWQTYTEVKDQLTTPQILPFEFSELGTALGITFPDMLQAWQLNTLPSGRDIEVSHGGTAVGLTPFLQLYLYPEPFLPLVFTFSFYYAVFTATEVILLRKIQLKDKGYVELGRWAHPRIRRSSGALLDTAFHAQKQTFMVVPYGKRHLYIWTDPKQDPACVEVLSQENVDEGYVLTDDGLTGWSLFSPVSARLSWQLQLVGYEKGDTDVYSNPTPPISFNLGENYGLSGGPTVEPQVRAGLEIYTSPAAAPPVLTQTQNVYSFEGAEGAKAEVQVRDEADNLWSSDGTHWSGNIRMIVKPPSSGDHVNLAPSHIDYIWVHFPRKLDNRAHSGIELDDFQFASWKAEAGLPNLSQGGKADKSVEVDLWDAGLQTLITAGLDEREGYPVDIWHDVSNDESYTEHVVHGWIDHPDLEEHHIRSSDGKSIAFYKLHAKGGFLSRADQPWIYEPVIVDCNNGGHVAHTYAVARVIDDSGYDSTDTAQAFIQDDPFPNSNYAYLPGDWVRDPLIPGSHRESIWSPESDETKLDYGTRIGREWRGWILYEDLKGRIYYHTDLEWEIALGGLRTYYVSATIYRSAQEAVDAGVSPKQVWRTLARRTIQPVQANVVKMYGTDFDGTNAVIVRDKDGYGSDTTYENFIGEPRCQSIHSTLAVATAGNKEVLNQLAAAALSVLKRRKVLRTVEISRPLWELEGVDTPDIGYVLHLQGLGDFIIIHHEAVEDHRNVRTSKVTCLRVSANAVKATSGTFLYPGRKQTPP